MADSASVQRALTSPVRQRKIAVPHPRSPQRTLGWLLALSDGKLCAVVATAFWLFAATNKMLVRATLLAVQSAPFLATPQQYGVQFLLLVPVLVLVHTAAFRIGLPARHRLLALAKHAGLMVVLGLAARLALDVAHVRLVRGNFALHDLGFILDNWVGRSTAGGDPEAALSPLIVLTTGLDIVFQYLIALALIAGMLGWKRYHETEQARARIALEAERARGMALRRQLDPHALFNTLNAVAATIKPNPQAAIVMIAALGDLLRETLESDRELSTVAEEFVIAGRYLQLYALRYPDRLHITIREPTDCADVLVPSLLLQPLIENAALHGVESGAAEVAVTLEAHARDDGGVTIAIGNTVEEGAELPDPSSSPGIGLKNTWSRLVTHYARTFTLRWERPSRVLVRLVLELPATVRT